MERFLITARRGCRALHAGCGDVAEWLGRGLQNLVQRFEPARHLFLGKWWNGIHAGLKILWPQGRVGSTPTLPITNDIIGPVAQLVRVSR